MSTSTVPIEYSHPDDLRILPEQGRTCYNCKLSDVCSAFRCWRDLLRDNGTGHFLEPEPEHFNRQARLVAEICPHFKPRSVDLP